MEHDDVVSLVQKGAASTATSLLPGPVALLSDLISMGLGSDGTQRLREAMQAEIEDAAFRRLPEVERRMDALEQAGVRVNASDFGRVLEHFARSWRSAADSKKRKVLEDAFVRSFDRELYESGLLNALWERLERLSYGELFLLRELIDHSAAAWSDGGFDDTRATLKLKEPTSLNAFHASNLHREGLYWTGSSNALGEGYPTELGKRLRNLAWEELPDVGDLLDGRP